MEATDVLRITLAGLLGAFGCYVSALNWYILLKRFGAAPAPSWIPLLGGAALMLSIYVEPSASFRRLWWTPLILDAGCVPGIVHWAIHVAWARGAGNSE